MKLIIDISEEIYARLLDNSRPMDFADGIVMDRAIRNGTPLNEVLDKIRTEIASYGTNSGMLLALEIIDKCTKGTNETAYDPKHKSYYQLTKEAAERMTG